MQKINLGVIFGGNSSEHEISLISASSILKNISKEKYNLFLIGITKQGEWFLFSGDISDIDNGNWEKSNLKKKAFISPDSSVHGIIIQDGNHTETIRLDAVMPVLHGKNGEDGTIQGIFELAQIPFVGCGTTASAICMDKVIANTLLMYNGIKNPKFHWFYYYDFQKNPEKYITETEEILKSYPLFVKPANSGSSVGISKVKNRDELFKAIHIAAKEDDKILIEENIDGHEIECAVLGNEEPFASILGEIAPSNEFYDYDAKYSNANSKLFIPARLPEDTSEKIRKIAIKAYKILGCSGLSRIDFLVEKNSGEIYINEINTFPGFTNISMYPKLMEKSGIEFRLLIDELVQYAVLKNQI